MAVFLRTYVLPTVVLLIALIIALFAMGRIPIGSGGFGFWSGAWDGSTSQNVADPYSLSHVLHGVIFFWALWPLRKRISLRNRFLIALLIEIAWEIAENSPFIIERYRANTASLEYFGDSILNSTFDAIFMVLGFWFAMRFSWMWSLLLFLMIELSLLFLIRDNLTLNVLMLLFPIDAIREWQVMGQ